MIVHCADCCDPACPFDMDEPPHLAEFSRCEECGSIGHTTCIDRDLCPSSFNHETDQYEGTHRLSPLCMGDMMETGELRAFASALAATKQDDPHHAEYERWLFFVVRDLEWTRRNEDDYKDLQAEAWERAQPIAV